MILHSLGDACHVEPPPTITIVTHCVNNRGIWGAGFVLAVGARWPKCKEIYQSWVTQELLGHTLFVRTEPHVIIANVVGQDGIGHGSLRISALETGLEHVENLARRISAAPYCKEVRIQMPRIGCGLAGAQWKEVAPMVERVFGSRDIRVLDLF